MTHFLSFYKSYYYEEHCVKVYKFKYIMTIKIWCVIKKIFTIVKDKTKNTKVSEGACFYFCWKWNLDNEHLIVMYSISSPG